jgi:hypothetical protein
MASVCAVYTPHTLGAHVAISPRKPFETDANSVGSTPSVASARQALMTFNIAMLSKMTYVASITVVTHPPIHAFAAAFTKTSAVCRAQFPVARLSTCIANHVLDTKVTIGTGISLLAMTASITKTPTISTTSAVPAAFLLALHTPHIQVAMVAYRACKPRLANARACGIT